jgi:hypothetical protein
MHCDFALPENITAAAAAAPNGCRARPDKSVHGALDVALVAADTGIASILSQTRRRAASTARDGRSLDEYKMPAQTIRPASRLARRDRGAARDGAFYACAGKRALIHVRMCLAARKLSSLAAHIDLASVMTPHI